jgi:hypothetical protein
MRPPITNVIDALDVVRQIPKSGTAHRRSQMSDVHFGNVKRRKIDRTRLFGNDGLGSCFAAQ